MDLSGFRNLNSLDNLAHRRIVSSDWERNAGCKHNPTLSLRTLNHVFISDLSLSALTQFLHVWQACIDENYELVSLLLDNGAELGIRDNEGWTPLHAAASCGSVEIAQ